MPKPIDERHQAHIALWYLVQQSLSSYAKLIQHFEDAVSALQPNALSAWQQLKLHPHHLQRFSQFHSRTGQADFAELLAQIAAHSDHILCSEDADYPASLRPYADRPPLLFVRGELSSISAAQLAVVGSRQTSPHGTQLAYDFAYYLAAKNLVVTSGLARGIDAAAHQGALAAGRSIAVIATGLDQCYPKEHHSLWQQIIAQSGCILSEFLPQTQPNKYLFPRRNRLISGLSLGTLVVEAGLNSGSLITAQCAAEQGKQVFAIPGHIYSPHHLGCHQLIREGATLVDHPEQILEDLQMFAPSPTLGLGQHSTNTPRHSAHAAVPELPEHLQHIWQQLDWVGSTVDELALRLNHDIATLSTALIELELLGLCTQHAGRYLRGSA
jgi:DNA processing protein